MGKRLTPAQESYLRAFEASLRGEDPGSSDTTRFLFDEMLDEADPTLRARIEDRRHHEALAAALKPEPRGQARSGGDRRQQVRRTGPKSRRLGERRLADRRAGAVRRVPEVRLRDLSERHREVLVCLCDGMTEKEVAFALGLSPKTVNRHREGIRKTLKTSRLALQVRWAIRNELIDA